MQPRSVLGRGARCVRRNGAEKGAERGRARLSESPPLALTPSAFLYSRPSPGRPTGICRHPLAARGRARYSPRRPGPAAAARAPSAGGRPAGTYLQPGFPAAAAPSDAPAASADPRRSYRSRIASRMPIRRHRSGA